MSTTKETSLEKPVIKATENTENTGTQLMKTDEPNKRTASLEEGVTGIPVMDKEKLEELEEEEYNILMAKIKNKPIGKGKFKKVYKLNDKEVISVEVNKEERRGEMVSVPFKKEEKEGYKNIMDKMYDLDDKHKKYLLLPTKYGYSSDEKTRVQILPYCNNKKKWYFHSHNACGTDLYDVLFKEGCSYEESIMTDCVNILKTIHELHKKKIACMDIKPQNIFVNCPYKGYLSLGDTDGFKNDGNDYNCTATPGFYVKIGHFITDYYALLQVFLLVYLSVKIGKEEAKKLYDSDLFELHGLMYDLRDVNDINEKLDNEEKEKVMEEEDVKMTDQALIDVFKNKKKFQIKLIDYERRRKERENTDPNNTQEYDEKSADLKKVVAWLHARDRAKEVLKKFNLKGENVHEDYKNLIMDLLEKKESAPSESEQTKDEILLQKILDALKACIDVETVNSYTEGEDGDEDKEKFYQKYIKPITELDIEPITITKKKSMFERMSGMFGKRRGGRKSKKLSRGKKKKTRRKKKMTRRKKKKTRRKKKKTRGKKRR